MNKLSHICVTDKGSKTCRCHKVFAVLVGIGLSTYEQNLIKIIRAIFKIVTMRCLILHAKCSSFVRYNAVFNGKAWGKQTFVNPKYTGNMTKNSDTIGVTSHTDICGCIQKFLD